ncbi:MAG: FAD-dependent thymidylate synthase [Firmicutes bacterium]|nr:FAD-dependent thymidylate synthase [Bacillota bacterium]
MDESYEEISWLAAGMCVGKKPEECKESNMLAAIKSGHISVLEHLSLTFLIEDVSRALTHQLVRHKFCVAA